MTKAVGEKRISQWGARGIGSLTPEHAFESLEVLIRRGVDSGVIASLHLLKLVQGFSKEFQLSFFRDLVSVKDGTGIEEVEVLHLLETAPKEKRYDILREYVSSLAAVALGFKSNDLLDVDKGFFQLGMDSLTSMEMRNRLESGLKRSFSSTLLFKYPSVVSLTDYLVEELFANRVESETYDSTEIVGHVEGSRIVDTLDVFKNNRVQLDEISDWQLEESVVEELGKLETLLDEL